MASSAMIVQLARMKFCQRLLLLGSICFLAGTVYYYYVLDSSSSAVSQNLPKLKRRSLGETRWSFRSNFPSKAQRQEQEMLASLPWQMDPAVCALMPGCEDQVQIQEKENGTGFSTAGAGSAGCSSRSSSPHPNANISTVDVYQQAQFNILADGMYELPSAPSDFPSSMNLRLSANGREGGGGGAGGSRSADAINNPQLQKPEMLNVIIMPHSHVDPGWQMTTSEYYADKTKNILNNMVEKLTRHPDMTFVWAETIYLAMWWNELEDATKVHVRRLIRRGQLEIALGGWVMPDEASTHYVSLVDQLLEGHQWLWENLGVRPQNSWSIDPFGYSGSVPYLWKLAGMDNMVIQRVHQAVKASLMSQRSMEFYWRQFWDNSQPPPPNNKRGDSRGKGGGAGGEAPTDILCHVMPYMQYSIDYTCGPNRYVCHKYDFQTPDFNVYDNAPRDFVRPDNVARMAEPLYKQFRQKAHFYRFNTILVPLGDDFRFDRASEWDQQYGNYSRLMAYMNGRKDWNINVTFGTLKDYFHLARLNQLTKSLTSSSSAHYPSGSAPFRSGSVSGFDSGFGSRSGSSGRDTDNGQGRVRVEQPQFPVLSGDFFPYSDRSLDYWTGYFTSRPFDKKFQREVQSLIQAADIAVTLTYAYYKRWGRPVEERFFYMASLMQSAHRGQAQFLHHDAITGTSRAIVVADYESRLLDAYTSSQSVSRAALQALTSFGRMDTGIPLQPETKRHRYDQPPRQERLWATPGGAGTVVLAFNPLPQHRQQTVRVLVATTLLRVQNQRGTPVPFQINPVWDMHKPARAKTDTYELVFVADLPPLATVPYSLVRDPDGTQPQAALTSMFPKESKGVNSTGRTMTIGNGKLRIFVDGASGKLSQVEDMVTGRVTAVDLGLEMYHSQGSGAYLFKPKDQAEPLPKDTLTVRTLAGPLLSEISVVYSSNVSQTFTLYHHPSLQASGVHIRLDLDIHTWIDREVIMRMKTDLNLRNPAEFFTDQNGMQYIRRRANDNVGPDGNYYPMTSGAFLDDGVQRLSLLSAQPHGVASLQPGWLEVMLDRHLLFDDDRGMGENLDDVKPFTSHFVLLPETRHTPRDLRRDPKMAAHYAFPSLLSWALGDRLQQPVQLYYTEQENNVHLSAFEPFSPNSLPSSSSSSSFPCDLALLSMRSLATRNLHYNGTSLILHRRAYDCDFPATPQLLLCPLMGKQMPTLLDLLEELALGVRTVRETSLTHVHHKRFLALSDALRMKPMQILALHLTF